MDPMIKNSFFTILIYWNDNRIHLGLTKKLIFFILFPPLILYWSLFSPQLLDQLQPVQTILSHEYLEVACQNTFYPRLFYWEGFCWEICAAFDFWLVAETALIDQLEFSDRA